MPPSVRYCWVVLSVPTVYRRTRFHGTDTTDIMACPVLIGGDFYVKVLLSDDCGERRINELLSYFDMVQHVKGPTHNRGDTLDLVIPPSSCPMNSVDIEPADDTPITPSSSAVCRLPSRTHMPSRRLVLGWLRADREAVQRMLDDCEHSRPPCPTKMTSDDVEELFSTYEAVLSHVAN